MDWYSRTGSGVGAGKTAAPAVTPQEAFRLLGLADNATADDLKRAWRKAAMMYHPDRHPEGPQREAADQQFRRLNEAAEVAASAIESGGFNAGGGTPSPGGVGKGPDASDDPEAPYEQYVDEKGRKRTRWNADVMKGMGGFARDFSAWLEEQQAWINQMTENGASDEAIEARMGYDPDDPYMNENAFVADQMRSRNEGAFLKDFDRIVGSKTPVHPPEKLGADLAAEWAHEVAPRLRDDVQRYSATLSDRQVTPEQQKAGLDLLAKILAGEASADTPPPEAMEPGGSGLLMGFLVARGDAGVRARSLMHGASRDIDLAAKVQFFRDTLPQERAVHGIDGPADVEFRYILSEGEPGGQSHVPMAYDRVQAAAQRGLAYTKAAMTAFKQQAVEAVRRVLNGGDVPTTSPRTEYLRGKLAPLVQRVMQQLPPEIKAKPDVQQVAFETAKQYLSHSMHDWEPDAGVHPYHADQTHPMYESILDRTLKGMEQDLEEGDALAKPGEEPFDAIAHHAEKIAGEILSHYRNEDWLAQHRSQQPTKPRLAFDWYTQSMEKSSQQQRQFRITERSTLFTQFPSYRESLLRIAAAVHQQVKGGPLEPSKYRLDPEVLVTEAPWYPQSCAYLPEHKAILLNDAQDDPSNYAIAHEYGHYLDDIFGADLSYGSSPEYERAKDDLHQASQTGDPDRLMTAWIAYHQHPLERNSLVRGAAMWVMRGMPKPLYIQQMGGGENSRVSPGLRAKLSEFLSAVYDDAKRIADHRGPPR